MFKSLKKYEEQEDFIKRELSKNSLFLEELAKLVVYLKNKVLSKRD